MKVLHLESVAGIAGDMFAAAFVHAGLVDRREVEDVPGRLGFPRTRVVIEPVHRASMAALHLSVAVHEDDRPSGHGGHGHGHHAHTHYPALDALLERSELPAPAKAFARKVFRILAEAEARAHGCAPEDVSFHEVGDVDSVVDVALAGLCVTTVAPDRVVASPVRLGRGRVWTRHGHYPVPPPASAHLAEGMPLLPVPEAIEAADVELSTPTGLAILKALEPEWGAEWPAGSPLAQGSGAGTRDFARVPNVFRVVLLEGGRADAGMRDLPYEADTVVEITCNVDDQTGERSAWLLERCMALGALDAWMTPTVGKKGRPALCFTLLARPGDARELADFVLRHASTFGLRYTKRSRLKLAREQEVRQTPRGPVRFSVGRTTEGEKLKEKPEFDDQQRIWEEDPDFRA